MKLSPMDDTTTVFLSVDSDEIVEGWLDATKPTLAIRCQERRLEAYVVTGLSAHVESGNLNRSTVRIRLDRLPPEWMSTGHATSNDALFFGDAGTLLRKMARSRADAV